MTPMGRLTIGLQVDNLPHTFLEQYWVRGIRLEAETDNGVEAAHGRRG